MGTIYVAQGTSLDSIRQVTDAAGNLYGPTNLSPFQGTDTLLGRVWQGDDLPVLFNPTITWIDPTVGTYTVSFSVAQTAAVAPGIYRYQALVTRASKTGILDDARLKVTISPGSNTSRITFTTLSDLLLYCPWIEDLQADVDQFGFLNEQARATEWLINTILLMYKQNNMMPNIGHPGFNAASLYGGHQAPPSKWLRDQLIPLLPGGSIPTSAPYRITTPPNQVKPLLSTALLLYDSVLECVAKRALSYVFDAQIGKNSEREWVALSTLFRRQSDSIFMCERFQIDLSNSQTGYASITVHGGSTNLR